MCLGIPGKITSIETKDAIKCGDPENDCDFLMRIGIVNFEGVKRKINLTYVPEAKIGDYVVVHVGFAISVVSNDAAKETLKWLEELVEETDASH